MRSAVVVALLLAAVGCSSASPTVEIRDAGPRDAPASALADAPAPAFPDAAPDPADAGDLTHLDDPCTTGADCPAGWRCVFFRAGCQAAGSCLPGCPGDEVPSVRPDASHLLCLCTGGIAVNSCATERYYQRYPWGEGGLADRVDPDPCLGYDGGF